VKTYKKPVGIFHQQQLSWFGEMTNNMSSTGEGVENTNFIKMLVFLLVVLPFKFELQADGSPDLNSARIQFFEKTQRTSAFILL
jgi:hypothetical protein